MLGLQLARHLGLPSEGGVRSACPDVFVFPMHAISQIVGWESKPAAARGKEVHSRKSVLGW